MIIREYLHQKRLGSYSTPPGFKDIYTNFPHYILDITEQIWEKRAIWLLYDTYDKDIAIHSGARTIRGLDQVIEGTLKTLYSFPDRTMGAESVIWAHYHDSTCASKESLASSDEQRFFSSHRIFSTATNTGATVYGKPTEKHIHFRTIADCLAKDNSIYEEWLVRDNLFVVQQLGFDPIHMATQDTRYNAIDVLAYDDGCTPIQYSQYTTHDTDEATIDFVMSLYKAISNNQSIDSFYHDDAISNGICDSSYRSPEQRKYLWSTLLSPFEEKALSIHQITATFYGEKTEIAIRWRLKGVHAHDSQVFGTATDMSTNTLGIHHIEIVNNSITQEWLVYDAFDTLCQLYRNKI